MEEVAERIVNDLAPRGGWQGSDAEDRLKEVALAMLEDMDEDTVEECMTGILSVAKAEHGE